MSIMPVMQNYAHPQSKQNNPIAFTGIIPKFASKSVGYWTCEEDLDTFLLPLLLNEGMFNRIMGAVSSSIKKSSSEVINACTLRGREKIFAYPLHKEIAPCSQESIKSIGVSTFFSDRDKIDSFLYGMELAKSDLNLSKNQDSVKFPLFKIGKSALTSIKRFGANIERRYKLINEFRSRLNYLYQNNYLHKKAYDIRDAQELIIGEKERLNKQEVEIIRLSTKFVEYKEKKFTDSSNIKIGIRGASPIISASESLKESYKTPNPYAADEAVIGSLKERLDIESARSVVENDFWQTYKAAMGAFIIKTAINDGYFTADELLMACRKINLKPLDL